jgi:hypothetical protein
MSHAIAGCQINGEVFLRKKDLLLMLTAIADRPRLTEEQRRIVAAIVKDLRAGWNEYPELEVHKE